MGRYATSTSIPLLMPFFLAGNTSASDTAGVDIWSAAADRAEGYINASITNRYDPQPWTGTGTPAIPPLIRKINEDLACLYSMRSAVTQDTNIKNMNLADWERSEQLLFDIRDGKIKLAYTDGSLVPTRSSSRFLSSTAGYNHVFGMDDEDNWDSGQVEQDDIDSERDAGS